MPNEPTFSPRFIRPEPVSRPLAGRSLDGFAASIISACTTLARGHNGLLNAVNR
jgi:hypothetical protein